MRKPVLRRGRTIWLGRTKPAARYPILRGHHETDVAIVGGGMTGAMIAEAFTRDGVRVAVVEAARIGQGSTAASTALLLQEPDYDLEALSDRYGARGEAHLDAQPGCRARFHRDHRRLKIACDLSERDSLYYTLDEERARTAAARIEAAAQGRTRRQVARSAALLRASGITAPARFARAATRNSIRCRRASA